MSVTFTIDADGYLKVTLTVNDATVTHSEGVLPSSDDTFTLLCDVCDLIDGRDEARIHFDAQPTEYRWLITRLAVNRIRIRVIEFPRGGWDYTTRSYYPDDNGKLLFDKPCGVVSFAKALYNGCADYIGKAEQMGFERRDVYFGIITHQRLGERLRRFDFSTSKDA